MKTKAWKSVGRAACFIVATALACHMVVSVGARSAHSSEPCARETVVRGRGLVTFGGYDLNVTFTTAGRIVCFDITDAKPAAPPA
jgi:hypothetical protein